MIQSIDNLEARYVRLRKVPTDSAQQVFSVGDLTVKQKWMTEASKKDGPQT